MPAKTYTLDEMDEYEDLASNARPIHLNSAAIYIISLCQEAGVQVGILGGYSLWLRGSRRVTTDIDVYFGGSMNDLKSVVNNGDRVIRPSSGLAADVYKVFVRTAGDWDDIGGSEQIVEVDMMPQGGLAGGTIETIHVDDQDIPVIDVASMLKNKLKAFDMRESANDLFDVQWLINKYPEVVAEAHGSIAYGYRERFIEAIQEQNVPEVDSNRLMQALDVTWPPIE